MQNRLALVVDDEPSIRRYVSVILQSNGFETVEAKNGGEGWRVVQTFGGRLDLIVSDIQMPEGDGISLARSVGACYPSIPFVLVSGYVRPELSLEVAFLQKPFLPSQFLRVVHKLIGYQAQAAGSPA